MLIVADRFFMSFMDEQGYPGPYQFFGVKNLEKYKQVNKHRRNNR